MTLDTLWTVLPLLALIFMASGTVKGLSGFGMPFIAVPGATIVLNVPISQAIAWVLVSGVATNTVQLIQTRREWRVLREVWPLVVTVLVGMTLSVQLLSVLDSRLTTLILGAVMVLSVGAQLWRGWVILPERRIFAMVTGGAVAGLFGGLTSFYGFPSLQVLVASGLRKDTFIFAASFLLFSGTLVLAAGLGSQGLMTPLDALISAILLVPALIGMALGQRLRRALSPEKFTRVVLFVLLATGLSLVVRSSLLA